PRNPKLVVAGLHVRLHDNTGLRRGAGRVPSGNLDGGMIDPQLIAVGLIVAVAALYVLRRTIRTWSGGKKGAGSGGCGCTATVEQSIPDPGVVQLEMRKK